MYPYEKNKQKCENVVLHTMQGNFADSKCSDGLSSAPFYIRRYSKNAMTHVRHCHEMMQINYMVKGSCCL